MIRKATQTACNCASSEAISSHGTSRCSESNHGMNEPSHDRSEHLTKWCKVAEFTLHNQTGYEVTASAQLEQALSDLQLPPSLLQKLRTSVYNAVVRICAAHAGGEVWVHLFITGQTVAERADGDPPRQTNTHILATEPGWGFFLVERRVPDGTSGTAARFVVELYCYQEGS